MQIMKSIRINSIIVFCVLILSLLCCNPQISKETNSSAFTTDSNSMAPYLFKDSKENIYASWIENKEQAVLKFSKFEEKKWSEPSVMARGTDWFVNWADYPIIISDGRGNLLSHYLKKSASDTYSYNIFLILSNNDGETWRDEFILNADSTNSEHGFVSAIPYKNGFLVSWLDGRNTVSGGPMSLRAAHINSNGTKLNEWLVDERVCDCCQTSLAFSKNGPVVVYRNRDENEVRDIAFSQLIGDKWTAPKIVFNDHWEIKGCPVNGPRLASYQDQLAIAWFTSPDGKNGLVKVSMFDHDNNEFKEPIILSDSEKAIGRVDIEFSESTELFTTWVEDNAVMAAKIDTKALTYTAKPIANINSSRKSGFPQMVVSESNLILLYTDVNTNRLNLVVDED